MAEKETRSFNVAIEMYRGHKIDVGEHSGIEIRFRGGDPRYHSLHFDVRVFVGNQKTLSSTKPTYARLETFYEDDSFDEDVKVGQKFYLIDNHISMKVATGHILEILKQPKP